MAMLTMWQLAETWTNAAWATPALRESVTTWRVDTGGVYCSTCLSVGMILMIFGGLATMILKNLFLTIWCICILLFILVTRCECHPGYYEMEGVCLDIDECKLYAPQKCHNQTPRPPNTSSAARWRCEWGSLRGGTLLEHCWQLQVPYLKPILISLASIIIISLKWKPI